MWDRAPGPFLLSQKWRRVVRRREVRGRELPQLGPARSDWVSGWPREDLAGLTFYVSFSFPQGRNRDSRFSPTLLFTKPP